MTEGPSERHAVVRQVYVTCAVLAFVSTFVPLWASERPGDTFASLNLWSAVTADGGGAAALGVLLVLGLAAAAVVGAVRPHGFGVPVTMLGLGVLALLLIITRPGAGDAELGPGAGLLLGTTVLLMVTALVDALMTPVAVRQESDGSPT